MSANETRMEIMTREGKVILSIASLDKELTFDPQLAVQIAHTLIGAAVDCGYQVEVVANGKPIILTSAQHNQLIYRASNIMRSMGREPTIKTAQEIVDTILAAVL